MNRIASTGRRAVFTLVVAFALALAAPVGLAFADTYVIDESGALDSGAASSLESTAQSLEQTYDVGVYLVFVDNVGSQSARQFAIDYYGENDLAQSSDGNAIMFLVATGSRDYVTITHGAGVTRFTDYAIDRMENDAVAYLKKSDWAGAGSAYYADVESALAYYATQGSPQYLQESNQQAKSYSSSSAGAPSDSRASHRILALVAAAVVAAIVAGGVVASEYRAMKTARAKSEAGDYLDRDSFKVVESNDAFVNSTLVTTPLPKASDDSSPGRFGGGFSGGSSFDSGGFGGSGGGKF